MPAKRKRPDDTYSIISVGKKCRDTGVRNVVISNLVPRKSPRLVNDVLRDLCTIDGFVLTIKTSGDCDICKDLLHLSYSWTCKLANNFIGAINRSLGKSSFWYCSVSSSKHGSVSASEKFPEKKQSVNSRDILSNLKVRVKNKFIIGNFNINSIEGKFDQLKLMV